MPADDYIPSQEVLSPGLDLLVNAGWVSKSWLDGNYLHIEWTPGSEEKAAKLFELLKEINGFRTGSGVILALEFVLGFTLGKSLGEP